MADGLDLREERGLLFRQDSFCKSGGLLVVYLFGMVYVYIINNFYLGTPIGVWPVVLYCFVLAVPGDICLCILAAMLASRLKRAIGKIAEGSLLHFRTPCEGEAHGKGSAQAAWLSSDAAHDIFFRAG